ncbi:MAG: hypothetical protein AAGF45_11795 [Pseudomonadota bacterium]
MADETDREKRLAAALRANLKRRKAQSPRSDPGGEPAKRPDGQEAPTTKTPRASENEDEA